MLSVFIWAFAAFVVGQIRAKIVICCDVGILEGSDEEREQMALSIQQVTVDVENPTKGPLVKALSEAEIRAPRKAGILRRKVKVRVPKRRKLPRKKKAIMARKTNRPTGKKAPRKRKNLANRRLPRKTGRHVKICMSPT